MTNNQQGFAYPLTLSILITFLIFFSMRVEQLLSERKMFHESKTIFQQEYYLLSTVKKVENMLQSGKAVQTGTIHYHMGSVNYQTDLPSGNVQRISFTLILHSGETGLGYGYYDTNTKKLIKWIEKN